MRSITSITHLCPVLTKWQEKRENTCDEAYGSQDEGRKKEESELSLSLLPEMWHLNQTLGNMSLGSHLQKKLEEPHIPIP